MSDNNINLSDIVVIADGEVAADKKERFFRYLLDHITVDNKAKALSLWNLDDKNTVSLHWWADVSSLEWPVVIYARAYHSFSVQSAEARFKGGN